MPISNPQPPVRVYYANWMFAGIWRRRDALREVARGRAEWVPLPHAPRPSLWADAGAGGRDELVLLLHRNPPSAHDAAIGWRAEACRGAIRDRTAALLPTPALDAPHPVSHFARTGCPVDGDGWRLVVRLTHRATGRRTAPR